MKAEYKTYQYYLRDLVFLLKDEVSKMTQTEEDLYDFHAGVKFGYTRTLDLIVTQAHAFQIDLKDIGFEDYEKWQERNNCTS